MKNKNFNDLHDLLMMYKVGEPSFELVLDTKRLMRKELYRLSEAPSWQSGWIFMIIGLALVMTMGLFYTFTVGTILSVALPAYIGELLHYSLYAFAAVGGSIIAGLLIVFYFKQLQMQRVQIH
ncbi:MAG: hypothetical protein JXB48_15780 [Candidatus Latescibacteria bacterium]|nr:hypothetical protein [Candidatus Latescibacterota bacterium]